MLAVTGPSTTHRLCRRKHTFYALYMHSSISWSCDAFQIAIRILMWEKSREPGVTVAKLTTTCWYNELPIQSLSLTQWLPQSRCQVYDVHDMQNVFPIHLQRGWPECEIKDTIYCAAPNVVGFGEEFNATCRRINHKTIQYTEVLEKQGLWGLLWIHGLWDLGYLWFRDCGIYTL